MHKSKKSSVIEELKAVIKDANAIFVADFKGLSMATMNQLRQKVRAAKGQFRVSKNTLTAIALGDGKGSGLKSFLTGNNGLAYTFEDPVPLAKALSDFEKEVDKFSVKSGILGENLLSPPEVKTLASLPSREIMLATLLGTLNSIPQSLVRVLAGVPEKFVRTLAALEEKKASEANPA
ncbi:MAG: 50S ribosomal protein L10 [Deltaproteobacteria bacterium]|jgi:large subunit ribosomal protein L10|nr:50S ribosomal protein L10 [Deltaproteobacteria bacterium]